MYRYLPIEESFYSVEYGMYISYGICVIDSNGEEFNRISDVSLNKGFIVELCEKCTSLELDANHLLDVIEDHL